MCVILQEVVLSRVPVYAGHFCTPARSQVHNQGA